MAFAGEGGQGSGGVKNQARSKRSVKKAKPYALPTSYRGDVKSNADKKRSSNYQKTDDFKRKVQDVARSMPAAKRQKAVNIANATAATKRSEAQKALLSLAKTLGSEAKDTKSDADRARADLYKKTDAFYKAAGQAKYKQAADKSGSGKALQLASLPNVNPAKVVDKSFLKTGIKSSTQATATAVKVLDQLNRPTKAVVAGVDKVASGKPGEAPKAALKSFKTNKGPLTGDVLRKHGVPKSVAGVAGFVGDVALDPLTYVSFGTGSAAKKAAISAGEKAGAAALARGATKAEAQKLAERKTKAALNAAAKKGKDNKGIQVTIGGRIPLSNKVVQHTTSGKATAAISRVTGVSKVAKRVRESNAVQKVGEDLVHDFKPTYFTEENFNKARKALGNYRAESFQAQQRAQRRGAAIRKEEKATAGRLNLRKKKKGSAKLIREIETTKNPENLSDAAKQIVQVNENMFKAEKNAGLRHQAFERAGGNDPVRYFPHVAKKESSIKKLTGKSTPAVQTKGSLNAMINKQRKISGTLEEKAKTKPFETDAAKAMVARESASGEALAKQKLVQEVGKLGRTVRTGGPIKLADGESLYRLEAGKLTKFSKEETKKAITSGSVQGRVVALDDRVVNYVTKRVGPDFKDRSSVGRAWDKANSKWKTVAMATPGFHIRNIFGDASQSLGLAGTSVRDVATSTRALRANHALEKSQQKTISGAATKKAEKLAGKTVKVGKERMTLKQLHDEAVRSGAVDAGYAVREIDQLAGGAGKVGKLRSASRARENLFRMATYTNARRRGMSPEAATKFTNKHHFDYGDLTSAERGARRAVPFYTFAARNTRLQASKLAKEPGKLSRIPKALEEAARAQGYESYDQFVSSLPEFDQEGVPIPVGKGKSAKAAFIQLPQSDLRRLNLDPRKQGRDAALMISPVGKTPVEMMLNYSTFYNDKISDPTQRPYVPAPSWVGKLPEDVKKKLGVARYKDKRRGNILGWSPNADYALRALGPHAAAAIDVFSPPKNNRGLDKTGRLTSMFGGVKLSNVSDRVIDRKIMDLTKEMTKLDEQKTKLKAQGKDRKGEYYTKDYEKLLDEFKKLKSARDKLKKARGDIVDDPKDRAKRRGGSSGGSSYGGGGSSYGVGAGGGGSSYGG